VECNVSKVAGKGIGFGIMSNQFDTIKGIEITKHLTFTLIFFKIMVTIVLKRTIIKKGSVK
jgi:hypothetical protein